MITYVVLDIQCLDAGLQTITEEMGINQALTSTSKREMCKTEVHHLGKKLDLTPYL
jgi:hypothetical protein